MSEITRADRLVRMHDTVLIVEDWSGCTTGANTSGDDEIELIIVLEERE